MGWPGLKPSSDCKSNILGDIFGLVNIVQYRKVSYKNAHSSSSLDASSPSSPNDGTIQSHPVRSALVRKRQGEPPQNGSAGLAHVGRAKRRPLVLLAAPLYQRHQPLAAFGFRQSTERLCEGRERGSGFESALWGGRGERRIFAEFL